MRAGASGVAVKYRLVIFDMDGTLADTFPWFTGVLNTVADKYRFRRVAPPDMEVLRGSSARQILEWLGVPLWKVPIIARHMRALKTQHLHEIALFPGVDHVLAELAARETVLAIVSSDSENNVAARSARTTSGALRIMPASRCCSASGRSSARS